MWNNDDNNFSYGDEGGFDNTTSMFSSPSQAAGKASSKSKCLANVTIRQILQSSEDGLKIKDVDVQTVKVVGIIKAVEVSSVKVRYVIEDHTGSIVGFVYLDNDSDGSSNLVENTYCIVVGSVRSQAGTKHIMIFNITPVEDFNFILEHMLTVLYMPLKLDNMETGLQEQDMKQDMMSSYGTSSNYRGTDTSLDIDPKYRRIYETISRSMSENGMSINEIQSSMPTKVPVDQIRNALDYLVGEGHIFTTIDEFHFKSIQSSC